MGKTRARSPQVTLTLDAGALIALDRGAGRMIALLQEMVARRGTFHVPAGVIGQAFRDGTRQAVLSRFLRSTHVDIRPLDGELARVCGELCAATHTHDVIDASVVLVAAEHGDTIITGDVEDLRRLSPSTPLERI